MYKTVTVSGETLKRYVDNLNKFYAENKNFEIIDIKHLITNYDDYTAIITVKE